MGQAYCNDDKDEKVLHPSICSDSIECDCKRGLACSCCNDSERRHHDGIEVDCSQILSADGVHMLAEAKGYDVSIDADGNHQRKLSDVSDDIDVSPLLPETHPRDQQEVVVPPKALATPQFAVDAKE